PKTRRSRRTIDLDLRTAEALRQWQERQANERGAWDTAWQDHGLVFSREDGAPIDPDAFSKEFTRRALDIGLPPIRLHDLRHSHASLLLASGVNPKVASERLGHHSVAFTLDVYSHVVPGMQSEAAERIAGLVLGDDPVPNDDPPQDVSDL
ncbi:MAG: site-specific integrase, partial [Nitriliruptoraceae bacterium]